MNKNAYRIVFNRHRGQWMVVAEIATSQGKEGTREGGHGSGQTTARFASGMNALKFALFSLFGLVSIVPVAIHAQIIADPNAPKNQQPTVINAGNGVPVVNIQTPSAAGVSRNTYQQLDVGQNGAILNNSRTNAQTQLGGWVQGNPWLANGTARIILNEVNSSNPSRLNGYIEVAGSRAQVVIANPSGISCDGCGFINADRGVLTTGTPIFNNGNLEAFRVEQGTVSINGAGLDATQTDYTQILARAVQINAGVWANQLTVLTGANEIRADEAAPDAQHGVVPLAASTTDRPQFGVDVAQLGGMYAGKITLVGTESGVGVRNAGNIGASAGDVVVTADGQLINAGSITSAATVHVDGQHGLLNSGTLYAGDRIASTVVGAFENSGLIGALHDINLASLNGNGQAGTFTNTSTGVLATGLQTDYTLTGDGTLSVTAQGGANAAGQIFGGRAMSWVAPTVSLADSTVQVQNFVVAGDAVTLDRATITAPGQIAIDATGQMSTRGATLTAEHLAINARGLDNTGGVLQQTGEDSLVLTFADDFINTDGSLAANGDAIIAANRFDNERGKVGLAGPVTVGVQTLNNRNGQILAGGEQTLTVSGALDNTSGTLQAGSAMQLDAASLANAGGRILSSGSQSLAVNVLGDVDNTAGQIAGNGQGQITAAQLANEGGKITFANAIQIDAQRLANGSGLVQTDGALAINATGGIDNAGGQIISQHAMALTAQSLSNAGGAVYVQGADTLAVSVTGSLDNTSGHIAGNGDVVLAANALRNDRGGAIGAGADLSIDAQRIGNASGTLQSGGSQTLVAAQDIDNTGGSLNVGGALSIEASSLANSAGSISQSGAQALDIHLSDALDNAGGAITSNAEHMAIHAGSLANAGGEIKHAGNQQLDLAIAGGIDNRGGLIAGNSASDISGTSLANDAGTLSFNGPLTATVASLSNTNGGRIQSSDALALTVSGNADNSGGIVAAQNGLVLDAQAIDNRAGVIVAVGSDALSLKSRGALDNTGGQIVGNGSGTLRAQTLLNDDEGTIGFAGDLSVVADNVTNRSGKIQSVAAQAFSVAQSLDNTGGTIATSGALTIAAHDLDNIGGTISQSSTDALSVSVEERLDNTRGTLASDAAQGQIRVGNVDNTDGKVGSSGTLAVAADTLINTRGHLTSEGSLTVTSAQSVVNTEGGFIGANAALNLTTQALDNQGGQIGSIQSDATITAGQTRNAGGALFAAGTASVTGGAIDNSGGAIGGDALRIDTQGQALINASGTLAGKTDVIINSGALNNASGLIQSEGNLLIDTHGQALTNTASGDSRGIMSMGNATVRAGDIDNSTGFIGSAAGVSIESTGTVHNERGVINARDALGISAQQVDNSSGQIQGAADVTVTASSLANDGGLLRAAQTLTITADALGNTNTNSQDHGLEGNEVVISAASVDNTSGAIRADGRIAIESGGTLVNRSGVVSASGVTEIKDAGGRTLTVDNEGGVIEGGEGLALDVSRYGGAGKLGSGADLSLSMEGDYTNASQIVSDGNITLATTGQLTNSGLVQSALALNVNARDIDNTETGEFNAALTHLSASGTITNRGLIDGGVTWLQAGTLNNVGTGRIYGDLVAIQAGQLNNSAEEVADVMGLRTMRAGTIAARADMQIGSNEINNSGHALIFSGDTLNIGGTLDENLVATGRAGVLNNHSSTVESLGDMRLGVEQVNNLNDDLRVEFVEVSRTHVTEYTGGADPDHTEPIYSAEKDGAYVQNIKGRNNLFIIDADGNTQRISTEFDRWDYDEIVTETRVTNSDPSVIQSGGNMLLDVGDLYNAQSKIVVGGTLYGDADRIRNDNGTGARITERSGTFTQFRNLSTTDYAYNPALPPEEIDLGAAVVRINSTDAGSGTSIGGRDDSNAGSGGVTGDAGSVQLARNGVGAGTSRPDGLPLGPNVVAPIIEVASNAGSGQVVRTTTPNLTLPDSSLFRVATQSAGQVSLPNSTGSVNGRAPDAPASSGNYLIETDPRFANYKDWLSSDSMLTALGYDPQLVQKRLGDGFYEQMLVRQQISQLTGQRFLDGYSDDEAQYAALLNNGATFAKQYGLVPGVALSAEQMALLTSDIVWLVEQQVTTADGVSISVLVPQVYARVQSGDINGSGTLIAAHDMQLNVKGNLENTGALGAAGYMGVTANDIVQTGGRINANIVDLKANNDILHTGGMISGTTAVSLDAIRNVTIASQTATASNGQSSNTGISRVAQVQVGANGGENGLLVVKAGQDANINAAELSNLSKNGITYIGAGNNINIGTVTVSSEQSFGAASDRSHRLDSASAEVGSVIGGNGTILMNAGNDLNARAATVQTDGAIGAHAGHDINITSGTSTKTLDMASYGESSGFMSKGSVSSQDKTEDRGVISSSFKAGGDLLLDAGNDVHVTGSSVSAKGDATVLAGNDIVVDEARQTSGQSSSHSDSKSKVINRSSATSDSSSYSDVGVSSTISGNTVNLQATNNLTVQQSNVVGKEGVALTAINGDVLVTAGQNYYEADYSESQKSSGISTFAGKGGIGVSVGNAHSDGEGHLVAVTQSDARSAVGATEGNVIVTAGKDATFIGSDVTAGRKGDDKNTGHIDVLAQNITVLAGEDYVVQSSASSSQSNGLGVAVVGTLFDTAKNLKAASQNDSKVTAGRQIIDEIAHAGATDTQIAVTASSTGSSSQTNSESLTHSGSSFNSAGDISLQATGDGQKDANGKAVNGDILIEGSLLTAGEKLKLDADRNVTVQASTDTYTEYSSSSTSGWKISSAAPSAGDTGRFISGGPNNSGVSVFPIGTQKSQSSGSTEAISQNASVLIGDSVDVTARTGDIRLAGSGIQANNDVTLSAKMGTIDILSGQESLSAQMDTSGRQMGDLGGTGYSGTVGIKTYSQHEDATTTSQSTVISQIVSTNGNVTMTAKDDINARGADIQAKNDVTMIGKTVNLDPAIDTANANSSSSSSQYGVTLALSGYAVQAAQAVENAAYAKENHKSDEVVALYATQAGLAIANGVGAGTSTGVNETGNPMNSNGGNTLIKATVSIGGSSNHSETHTASTTQGGATITAGGTATIIATGSGAKDADGKAIDGDINMRGATINATNVTLNAAHDLNAESVQNTATLDSQSQGNSAGIGVGFGLGGSQNGFTLELAASQIKGMENGQSVTQVNTHVNATGTLTITTGNDANIAGAQLTADRVEADIGHDLNIRSRQDTETYDARTESGGFQASLCIPPFCYGTTVSASGNYSEGNTTSTFASVNEQSGIFAGDGGYDIKVKGNTDLQGGAIVSTATPDKNYFETRTLTTSDVENYASFSSDKDSIALSYSGGTSGAGGVGWADGTLAKNAAVSVLNTAAANGQAPIEGQATGTTKSVISQGTIVITDNDEQIARTGKTADETIASINHDADTANGKIDKIFDAQQVKEQQELADLRAQTMQQAAPLLYKNVGDMLEGQDESV
ncbi:hemagglutinin repeat-containing protein, partial [Uliginosibacterium sp. sgz301328]|uniref:hemagglutinin repeat-containing protein n=1 Tax=Uliginosibacterium sp. sgz301328 TaxID=3243764 RepID=UPI00359E3770